MNDTTAALDSQRVRGDGQILRLLQRVTLQECEAGVSDACDVAIVWVS